jgi:uncharacterized membrane protein (DUF106 family)
MNLTYFLLNVLAVFIGVGIYDLYKKISKDRKDDKDFKQMQRWENEFKENIEKGIEVEKNKSRLKSIEQEIQNHMRKKRKEWENL